MKKRLIGIILAIFMLASVLCVGIVPAAAETSSSLNPTQGSPVQGKVILHCFNWSYNEIRDHLAEIKAAGYTAVQTSPVQQPKDYDPNNTDSSDEWWKLYQPLGLSISPTVNNESTSWLGTREELTQLCTAAEAIGIKVIVDIVANHLANIDGGGAWEQVNPDIDHELYINLQECFHPYSDFINDSNRFTITQYQMGMPDLNTSNSIVQSKVMSLLDECIACGVDGFRFDAAKHIELPTDPVVDVHNYASDFWPNILNYINSKGNGYYVYGEILGGAGTDISNYTTYMDVTDNETGNLARIYAAAENAGALADGTYKKGTSGDNCVIWVESHDTYMDGSSSGVSAEKLIKAWAIVGARADSTALYLARPNATMGLASSDETWKSDEVSAVNAFKNHFTGTSEYLSYSGSTTYIERGTNGVVISKLDGAGAVNLTAHKMADGTYKDQITNNTFTVSNGVISGTVGSSGVAVVYDENAAASEYYIDVDTLYLKPNANWASDGAWFATYLYNTHTDAKTWVGMDETSSGSGVYSAAVPSGNWTNVIFVRMKAGETELNWGNKWNQTINLSPERDTNCFTITSGSGDNYIGTWSNHGSLTVYAINNAGWSTVYIHYWGGVGVQGTDWPGVPMTAISGTKVYEYSGLPENVTGIIFNNGSGSQTGNIESASGFEDGASWTIDSYTGSYYETPTYYLVGTMNNWTESDDYAFTLGACSEGKVEYRLTSVYLAAGSELKVKNSNGDWYPGGDNYTVAATGRYNIYFRPNGDGGNDWYSNSIYLEAIPTVNPTVISQAPEIRPRATSDYKSDLRFIFRVDFNNSFVSVAGSTHGDSHGVQITNLWVTIYCASHPGINGVRECTQIFAYDDLGGNTYFTYTMVIKDIPESGYNAVIEATPKITLSGGETVTSTGWSASVNALNGVN